MSKAPAFQLYASDFLGDHLVDAMEPEELGGYFRLLLVAWQQEEQGYLPNDPAKLAAWSRLRKRWTKHADAILACFKTAPDGRLYQKRMVAVAAEQAAYRAKQREKGLASAAAREANRKATKSLPESNRGSTAVQPRHQPEGNPLTSSPPPPETVERDSTRVRAMARAWGEETGELQPEAYQFGLVRDKLESYADLAGEPIESVTARALEAFKAEVASWTESRPLTAKLFNAKWAEVQARMAGKVPASSGKPRASPSRGAPLPPMPPATESKTELL